MPRVVQTHLKTQPTPKNRPDPIWHRLTRLLRQLVAGLLHQKPIPASRFQFPSPQNPKNLNCPTKTQIPAKIFQISVKKTQILAIFQVNLMRFWPDLAKSHQIQWDFRQIWWNLIDSDEIFAGFGFSHRFLAVFSPFSQIYDANRPLRHLLKVWSARPVYSGGRRRVGFSATRFRWVSSGLGTNLTWTDPWTALLMPTSVFWFFFFLFLFDKGLLVCFVSRQV